MKAFYLRGLCAALFLSLLILNTCGDPSSKKLIKSAERLEIPHEEIDFSHDGSLPLLDFDVTNLKHDLLKKFQKKNPIGLFIRRDPRNQELYRCTQSLLSNGFILTNAHCIESSENPSGLASPENLFVYFKNLEDKTAQAFKVTQIVSSRKIIYPEDMNSNEYLELSDEEAKMKIHPFLASNFKAHEDWALLKIERSSEALRKFGALIFYSHKAFQYKNIIDQSQKEQTPLKYVSIGNKNPQDDQSGLKLKIILTHVEKNFIDLYSRVLSKSFQNTSKALLTQYKTIPLVTPFLKKGFSGSPVLYNDKVIGLVQSFIQGPLNHERSCSLSSAALWFPALEANSEFWRRN